MYYLAADLAVMAIEISTAPTFTLGKPRLLLRPPPQGSVGLARISVSQDGAASRDRSAPERLTRPQITVFDRQGNVLNKIGRSLWSQRNPAPSRPMEQKGGHFVEEGPQTHNENISTIDVASGRE